jgi:hypothetical protein
MKSSVLWLGLLLGLASCGQDSTQLSGAIGTGNTAGVAGIVLSSDHSAKADVHLFRVENPGNSVQFQKSDSTGAFRFASVSPGKYLIFANQNGILGMLSDTFDLSGIDIDMKIHIKPYILVPVDDNQSTTFCGVAANRSLQVDINRYWKIPQSEQTLWVDGSKSMPSVRYNAQNSTVTLTSSKGSTSTRLVHDTVGEVDQTPSSSMTVPAGTYGRWITDTSQIIRISMIMDIDSFPSTSMTLISFGDSIGYALDSSGGISSISNHARLSSLSIGKRRHLEFLFNPGARTLLMSDADGRLTTSTEFSYTSGQQPTASTEIHLLNAYTGYQLHTFNLQSIVIRNN